MSRSKKKTKIIPNTTARSEKADKQQANRTYRRIIKQKLKNRGEDLPKVKEVSNVWDFDKDGKRYNKDLSDKDLRK